MRLQRTTLTLVLALATAGVAAQTGPIRRWSTATASMDSDAAVRRPYQLARDLSPLREIAAAPSDFRVVRHDVLVDVPRGEAVFNLWLSEVPDFRTVDAFGRQAHSFQYYVDVSDFSS